MGSTNLAFGKVPFPVKLLSRLYFQGLSLFLGKEKLAKCTYIATGRWFIHPPLIFSTQEFNFSLQHIKLCICLLSQSL